MKEIREITRIERIGNCLFFIGNIAIHCSCELVGASMDFVIERFCTKCALLKMLCIYRLKCALVKSKYNADIVF